MRSSTVSRCVIQFTKTDAVGLTASSLAGMRSAAEYLVSQLILPLAQVDDMPEQAIGRPFDIADFNDHLGPHPMDPAKHQW